MFNAWHMGRTPHLSPLLRKAGRLGYRTADHLLGLAVLRGCRHYADPGADEKGLVDCGKAQFSNDELAVSLISGGLDGEPRHIRCAAQLLRADDINAELVLRLSRMERCLPILKYIAECGVIHDHEGKAFWEQIVREIRDEPSIRKGRLPHPSRFVSNPGWTPSHRAERKPAWLKPE